MAVSHRQLHVPPLTELSQVLQNGLKKHFEEVSVSITECPNLEEAPFHLAAKGISGNTRLADIGGVPYLLPIVQREKVYDLQDVAKKIDLPNAFIIGAGAGPHHVVGVNSELIPNLKAGEHVVNKTHRVKVLDDGTAEMINLKDCTEMSLLANIFASDGLTGPVVRVSAKRRKEESSNLVSLMRECVRDHYGEKAVGLGGVFLIEKGKAKVHVMPDFSKVPLESEEALDNWLKFFTVSAPMICLSTCISHDPGLDLRVEHTHCFSTHGEGGHYHYDTTPKEVEYLGYFNVAEYIYRIDPPEHTHTMGRD